MPDFVAANRLKAKRVLQLRLLRLSHYHAVHEAHCHEEAFVTIIGNAARAMFSEDNERYARHDKN